MNTLLNTTSFTKDISNKIPSNLHQYMGKIWLVGSQARGNATRNSDTDFLIETRKISSGLLLKKIRASLSEENHADTLATYYLHNKKNKTVKESSRKLHFVIAKPGEEKLFPERIQLI
jgi:predicted nucleotidyltransferase